MPDWTGGERERLERDFFAEAEEIFDTLTSHLRALEESVAGGFSGPPQLNSIFREVHSLKGLAALQGLKPIVQLAHALEDLLERLRMGRKPLDGATLDLIQETFDGLAGLVRGLAAGASSGVDPARLVERLRSAAAVAEEAKAGALGDAPIALDPHIRASLSAYEEHRLSEAVRSGTAVFLARLRLDPQDFDGRLREAMHRAEGVGELIATVPLLGESDDPALLFCLIVGCGKGGENLTRALQGFGAEITPLGVADSGGPPGGAGVAAGDEASEDLKGVSESLRVPVARLDEVLEQVADLSIALAAVVQSAKKLGESLPDDRGVRDLDRGIRPLMQRLRALQRSTIAARLVPVEQVFGRIGRMVARAARAAGKEVELHTLGGETELDKAMMDQLASPLVHLLRNALDHGIEPPEERERAGKRRRGRLVLSAFPKGRMVLVDVSDDGRGVSTSAVLAAARNAGLIAPDRELSADEARELIFAPRFSTARTVSEASGRGIGLDVVRRSIRRLKGSIVVRSVEGKGTTFTVTVPITLALVQALIVRAGGQRFAIPIASIRENVRLEEHRRRRLETGEVYDHPLGTLPLLRLDRLVGAPPSPGAGREAKYAVVAGSSGGSVALAVDDLLGQQEVVIKPVGRQLGDLPGLAGATDLGDATAVLVLDPEGLLAGGTRDRAVS